MLNSDPERRMRGLLLMTISFFFTLMVALSPSAVVVESPGPILKMAGFGDRDIVKLPGKQRVGQGQLAGLSVYLNGNPANPLRVGEAALAMIDKRVRLMDMEAVYPKGINLQDFVRVQTASMRNSQQSAIAVAMRKLGKQVKQKVVVHDLVKGSPSEGKLEPDDELLKVDGQPVESVAQVIAALKSPAVELTIRRNSQVKQVTVNPQPDDKGKLRLGILAFEEFEFDTPINFDVKDVGGPSAGMMFSLAVYELFSGKDITGGNFVAGTGTIKVDGQVGEIGGMAPKMWAAYDAGAKVLLLPPGNCPQLAGIVPDDLFAYSVESFDQALSTLESFNRGEREMHNRCR